MQKLVMLSMLIFSVSVFSEARDVRFQKIVNELGTLSPAKDKDKEKAAPLVGQVEDLVEKFQQRPKHDPSEFADLVTLTAFASPFMSFPDTAGTLDGLKYESAKMKEAFKIGLKGVDDCRRKQFLFMASNDGEQDGAEAVARSKNSAGDFNYAKCVAAKK